MKTLQWEGRSPKLQNRCPKLTLTFSNGQNHSEIKIRQPKMFSEEYIRQQIDEKSKNMIHAGQRLDRRITSRYDTTLIEIAAAREYENAYRTYLKRMNDYAVYSSKIYELDLILQNQGTASAEDTDVYIQTQGDFSIINKTQTKPVPKEPPLPAVKPRKGPFSDFNFDHISDITRSIVPIAEQIRRPNVSAPKISKTTAGHKVHFHVQRIKQGIPLALDNICVIFPTEPESFSLKYTINSHSLPENISGDLHIKVSVPEQATFE